MLAFSNSASADAAIMPPVKGGKLPAISLPIPKNPVERSYLGLVGNGFFKISQIKAEAVIIKIFNTYCPACLTVALAMPELYHRIENEPELKGKMKVIGIGVGNTAYEIELFKETFNIPYPVFPDSDFSLHKAFGEVRTPYFIAARIKEDGSNEVFYTQLGAFTETGQFLDLVLEAYGKKPKESSKGEVFGRVDL